MELVGCRGIGWRSQPVRCCRGAGLGLPNQRPCSVFLARYGRLLAPCWPWQTREPGLGWIFGSEVILPHHAPVSPDLTRL